MHLRACKVVRPCLMAPPMRACKGMLFAGLLCFATAAALAQSRIDFTPVQPYSGTLQKMNEGGAIQVGYRENSPPFAFRGADGKPVGYALDLCEAVLEEARSELRKEIQVEYRPVTPENRFEQLTSGRIDLECGSTTNTIERRQNFGFSPTMFVTGTKLLVKRGSGIRSLRDLQGRKVVLTRGTVHAQAMPKLAERQKLSIEFITAADHDESFARLAKGEADAFANDDVQLYGMLAAKRAASDFRVVGDFLTYADYALMLRKDDTDLADVVQRAFERLATSREISAIYQKWFLKALPSGERLNLPMSPHLEHVFRLQGLAAD
jgi:glutamate/aspartate transport system substrate-binding protein